MPIWEPSSEPRSYMTRWMIYRVKCDKLPEETDHVVGWCSGEGRVSSPIQKLEGCVATTRSGREYFLEPTDIGLNFDGEYVFQRWIKMNSAIVKDNVTGEYLKMIQSQMETEEDNEDSLKKDEK